MSNGNGNGNTDDDYRDLLDYVVDDLEGQKSKLLLTPQNSASQTSTDKTTTDKTSKDKSLTSKMSSTKMSTLSTAAEECQIFLIIGGVLGSLLVKTSLFFFISRLVFFGYIHFFGYRISLFVS